MKYWITSTVPDCIGPFDSVTDAETFRKEAVDYRQRLVSREGLLGDHYYQFDILPNNDPVVLPFVDDWVRTTPKEWMQNAKDDLKG